jgi:hypothetical protein
MLYGLIELYSCLVLAEMVNCESSLLVAVEIENIVVLYCASQSDCRMVGKRKL